MRTPSRSSDSTIGISAADDLKAIAGDAWLETCQSMDVWVHAIIFYHPRRIRRPIPKRMMQRGLVHARPCLLRFEPKHSRVDTSFEPRDVQTRDVRCRRVALARQN